MPTSMRMCSTRSPCPCPATRTGTPLPPPIWHTSNSKLRFPDSGTALKHTSWIA